MLTLTIDVRQLVKRHAFLIQKAAEVETESDGADIRNPQAVADERIRCTATGDPLDTVLSAILEDAPDHEKVFFVTDRRNDF